MSCFCDCSRENVKENKLPSITQNTTIIKQIVNPNIRESNFDIYMTKKISHALPTIKESFDEEEELKTRNHKGGKKIQKKLPDVIDQQNKQFYEFKEQLLCMFCGGETCKHENWKLHPNTAIKGLNCDRITEDLFASQRLSNRLIDEYDLINSFKQMNIGLIVNLQREGEHPYCGDKLDVNSGFSYDPQKLISEDIKYRNFGWEDMSIPDSMGFMINIMKEMLVTILEEKKKVLVHCHAGYGRTGIVIACYMITVSNKSAEEIVTEIRTKRPKCIQKTAQMDYCKKFREFIDLNRCIYTTQIQAIDYYIKNQNNLLFGEDAFKYKNFPKIFVKLIDQIIMMKKELSYASSKLYQDLYFLEFWDEELENKICELKKEINKWKWNVIDDCKELPILIQLFYDWIGDCVISVIPAHKIISIYEKIPESDFKKESDKEFSKNICLQIKTILKSNEYECLVYVAKLIIEIFPTKQEENEMFNRVLEKLMLMLSGINPRKISYKYGEKNDNIPSQIVELFRKFNNLINFLSNVIKYDYDSDTNIFLKQILYNSSFYGNKTNMTLLNGINIFKSDKNPTQKMMISALEEDKSFEFKNIRKLSSFQMEDTKERDKNMYQIYQMLNHYFCSNNSSLEDDPVYFEKDINSSMFDIKEENRINQSIKNFTKSKTIKIKNEYSEFKKKPVDTNEMIVDLFEHFQNFLKSQNLPKININTTSEDNSSEQIRFSQTEIKNSSKKKDMQTIEEDPNENKFSRGISLVNNHVLENKEESKHGDTVEPNSIKNVLDLKENIVKEIVFENPENNLIPVSSARIQLPKITKSGNKNKCRFGYKFFQSDNFNQK